MWVPKQPDGANKKKKKFEAQQYSDSNALTETMQSLLYIYCYHVPFLLLFCTCLLFFFPSFPGRIPDIRQRSSLKYLLWWSKLCSPSFPQVLLQTRKVAHAIDKKLHLEGWCLKLAYWKLLKYGEILIDLVIQAVKTEWYILVCWKIQLYKITFLLRKR